jgi:hypothetical protein
MPEPEGLAGHAGGGGQLSAETHTPATQFAEAGGIGITQLTVHPPFLEMTAAGETSHGPARLSMTNTSAPDGSPLTVPFHTYSRPGGGGWGRSNRPVMAMRIGEISIGEELAGLISLDVPEDPPSRTVISAMVMLAMAATPAASSTCHRSRRRHRFFWGRVPMDHSLPARTGSGQASKRSGWSEDISGVPRAPADEACRSLRDLALVDLSLECGGAGGAQGLAAEAVAGSVPVPASGPRARGTGARLA